MFLPWAFLFYNSIVDETKQSSATLRRYYEKQRDVVIQCDCHCEALAVAIQPLIYL
jgi:hypothetical protein